jgi:hypothetical protein
MGFILWEPWTWSRTDAYLVLLTAFTVFRVFMYVFFKEAVSKIKVTKAAWENPGYRECMYAYTTMVLMFMTFRLFMCFVGFALEEGSYARDLFCKLNLLQDVGMFIVSLKLHHRIMGYKQVIFVHHMTLTPPALMQGILVVAGIWLLML